MLDKDTFFGKISFFIGNNLNACKLSEGTSKFYYRGKHHLAASA